MIKLLLDQNLSYRLVAALTADFPGTSHVRHHGLDAATDNEIWDFALQNGYAILSKDSDFYYRASLYSIPAKVIWLCVGNVSTDQILIILREYKKPMIEFITHSNDYIMVIS